MNDIMKSEYLLSKILRTKVFQIFFQILECLYIHNILGMGHNSEHKIHLCFIYTHTYSLKIVLHSIFSLPVFLL